MGYSISLPRPHLRRPYYTVLSYCMIMINIITVVSWLSPLISQLFHPEGCTLFIQPGCFCMDFTSFCSLHIYPKPHKCIIQQLLIELAPLVICQASRHKHTSSCICIGGILPHCDTPSLSSSLSHSDQTTTPHPQHFASDTRESLNLELLDLVQLSTIAWSPVCFLEDDCVRK